MANPQPITAQGTNKPLPALPNLIKHILLLWRLRITISGNTKTRWLAYSSLVSIAFILLLSGSLAVFCFWFMTHPSISAETAVADFYFNILCFVTAMLWFLWPILSAGIEDGSEQERYHNYPISETRLLLAATISGVFKPVGFIMFSPLIGAAFGYAWASNRAGLAWVLPMVVVYIAMCAAWSQTGVYWMRDMLRTKRNGQALSFTLILAIAVGMLLPQVDITWLYEQGGGSAAESANELDEFARISNAFSKIPPGYLGEGIKAISEQRFKGAVVELMGMLILTWVGFIAAKRRLINSHSRSSAFKGFQNQQSDLFSKAKSPDAVLVKREIIELWRNPRFRLLVTVPFFLIVVLHLVSATDLASHFFGAKAQFWLMLTLGCYGVALILLSFTYNAFAYDGRGLLKLVSVPVTPRQILKAKAIAHAVTSLATGVATSLFYWQYVAPVISTQWVLLSLLAVFILVPTAMVVGLWLSMLYPVKLDAGLNRKERQPLSVNIIGFATMILAVLPIILAAKLGERTEPGILLFTGLPCLVALAWLVLVYELGPMSRVFYKRQLEIISAVSR